MECGFKLGTVTAVLRGCSGKCPRSPRHSRATGTCPRTVRAVVVQLPAAARLEDYRPPALEHEVPPVPESPDAKRS